MKKRTLSAILLSAAVLSSAFLMTSCGGNQIDQFAAVNTSGSYVVADTSALNTYISSTGVQSDITTGYHFSVKMNLGSASAFVNMLVKTDDLGVPTAAALKMEAPDTFAEIYIKDHIAYTNIRATLGGQTFNEKSQTTLPEETDILSMLNSVSSEAGTTELFSASDYASFVNELLDDLEGAGFAAKDYLTFEVAQNEGSTKFHVRLKQKLEFGEFMSYDKFESYICFDNNKFVGAKCESVCNIKGIDGKAQRMSFNTAISTFNGDIQVPNFDTNGNGNGNGNGGSGFNKNPFDSNLF